MNLFGTLNTAVTGMSATELSLQTAGHNIANANNPNYSRQRVEVQTLPAMHMTGIGDIGMGAKASSVERVVDQFVQTQLNQVNSTYNGYSERSNVLSQLEGYYNEPSNNGILAQLDKLNASWTSLANDPSNVGIKTTVIGNAQTVTDSIKQLASNMQALQTNTVGLVTKNALDFNQTVKQLDLLNQQIYNASQANDGSKPNDLLDTRDQLVQKISGIADTTTTFDKYGRATVSLNNTNTPVTILDASKGIQGVLSVVSAPDSSGNKTLLAATDDMTSAITSGVVPSTANSGDVLIVSTNRDGKIDDTTGITINPVTISGGTISGDQAALSDIKSQVQDVNKFAYQLANTTNTLMTANGVDSTKAMYTFSGSVTNNQPYDAKVNYAANIGVNQSLVSESSQLKSGTTTAAGDGSLASAIAKLQNAKLGDVSTPPTLSADKLSFVTTASGSTVSGIFNNLVTKNGIVNQAAKNNATSQLALLQQAQAKQQAVSGVNMNEEMSNVIKFQQGFQANAKMISVINEMLDTLINRTGVN